MRGYQDGGGRENAKICDESVFLHLARKFSKLSFRSTCRDSVQLNCHKASTEVAMPDREIVRNTWSFTTLPQYRRT